jgi:hypothetical protein
MPSTTSRRRLELPLDIYAALTQVAAQQGIPTAALASLWLQDRLQREYPQIRTNPNTYRYRVMHERRADAKVYTWGPPMFVPPEEEEVHRQDD